MDVDVWATASKRRGVRKLADSVEHAVIAIDSATSAFARRATTFEAAPPGQHPTRMTPSRSAGLPAFIFEHTAARAGITQNCASTPPTNAFFRFEKADVTSFKLNVQAAPNMAPPKAAETHCPGSRALVAAGNTVAAVTAANTVLPKYDFGGSCLTARSTFSFGGPTEDIWTEDI